MPRSIQVRCTTAEEMEHIRSDLIKEFDGLFDFNEEFVYKYNDHYYSSWPEIPKESEFEGKMKHVSSKHKGVRFTIASASHLPGEDGIVENFYNYKDGDFAGFVSSG